MTTLTLHGHGDGRYRVDTTDDLYDNAIWHERLVDESSVPSKPRTVTGGSQRTTSVLMATILLLATAYWTLVVPVADNESLEVWNHMPVILFVVMINNTDRRRSIYYTVILTWLFAKNVTPHSLVMRLFVVHRLHRALAARTVFTLTWLSATFNILMLTSGAMKTSLMIRLIMSVTVVMDLLISLVQ